MTTHLSGKAINYDQSVTASLQFAAAAGSSTPFVDLPVPIYDARYQNSRRSLDREGFVLARHSSCISNFYDPDQVAADYYTEIERFVHETVGANLVVAYTHAVRCTPKADECGDVIQRPFKFVHNDYTASTGPLRAREVLRSRSELLMQHRFVIINLWRPIQPIQECPLAVCDSHTVGKNDLVSVPSRDPSGRVIRIYTLTFNPEQRWFYFPAMQPNELLLFKTFDSVDDGRARYTFHSAFDVPYTPDDTAPRESIEVRVLAVFV